MRASSYILMLGVLSFAIGCNKTSESENTSTERNASRQDGDKAILSPTSQSTNQASRVYSGENPDASAVAPDNTGKNIRDRDENAKPATEQSNSEPDREMTRRIRRAVMENNQLSTTAKNVKIVTVSGKVTLRGPVNSEQEAQAIAEAAKQVAGADAVDNQLEVKATNQ